MACLAGIFFLVRPAKGFDSGLTETEGAIRTWRSGAGLPADSVTAIIQTRDGYLWIGTTAGLVRFDGVKFTPVKLSRYEQSVVAITALCEDSLGQLWIGTLQNGLYRMEHGDLWQFTKSQGLLDLNVTSMAAGSNGRVWVGTKSGLNLFTGKDIESFTVREGLPDEFVSGVHVARSGNVWITTRGGMCQYSGGHIVPRELETESQGRSPEYLGVYEDRRGNLWAFGDTYLINLAEEGKRFNYFRGNEATSVRIWSLCEGRDGRLWIGTSGRGLFCFDENRFQSIILDELRWPYDVRAICEDFEGNLWLGTSGGGLVQLRPQPVHVMRTGQGLPASEPTALAMDSGGRVYVGLQRGGIYVGDAGRFDRFGALNGWDVQDYIAALTVGRDGTLWAGTLGGGVYGVRSGRTIQFTTADGLADNQVLAICADREGNIWASTSVGTLHRFAATNANRLETMQGFGTGAITSMIAAKAGGLWLGTTAGSILRVEGGKFSVRQEQVGQRPVVSLWEGEQGQLWIGTSGDGLRCLAGEANANWSYGSGLPNNYVAGVVGDDAGNLWLATGAGICRISRASVEKSLSDPAVPLACKMIADSRTTTEAGITPGGVRALPAGEGRLWFASSEGVLNVDTRRPETEASPVPVYIESISFNEQAPVPILSAATWSAGVSNLASFTAPADFQSLEIQFTALSFTAPEKTHFRHKLEKFDADWVEDGTTRFKRYERLPYGSYTFRVAARTADGPWQEAARSFSFEVPTPLYLQPWAILLYGVAAIGLVGGIVRVVSHRRLRSALAQLEQQQALERERMRIARDMHDEIGSKLTKISFLSEHARVDVKADGPLAGRIESIAETSRELLQTMDEIVWVVNPRNDTLEHLAAYLGHYADEYFQNTTVECELRLPQALSHWPVSSETRHNLFLAFEETLNNVLKHSGAAKVRVEMAVRPPRFEIIVSDDGRGFDAARPVSARTGPAGSGGRGGNGLRNMRQRLGDIGGECEVRSQAGAGTTVILRINLQQNAGKRS